MDNAELEDAGGSRWDGLSFDLGDDLMLRRFTDTDVDAIFECVKRNEKHLHFMHWATPDYSREMAAEFVERQRKAADEGESVGFGIFHEDRMLGSIGFVKFDREVRETEIGYWIDHDEEGKGIITRATKALIDWAINTEGMNRIEIRCDTANERSVAVPARLGFKREAHLRQVELRHGKLRDFYVFGLLASEWKSK